MMKRLLIIKTGSTLPHLLARRGDFEDWVINGMSVRGESVLVVDVSMGEPLPGPDEVGGAVITGSHAMVTDHHDWSERTARWLQEAFKVRLPMVGICYGHQLLAYALGGEVGDNPNGRECGTVDLHLNESGCNDRLTGGLGGDVRIQACHAQCVLKLPPQAGLLGFTDMDGNAAFVAGNTVWGLQFHPEFDGDIVRAYICEERSELIRETRDPDRLIRESVDTPYGSRILRRFAELLEGKEDE